MSCGKTGKNPIRFVDTGRSREEVNGTTLYLDLNLYQNKDNNTQEIKNTNIYCTIWQESSPC